MAGFNGSAKTHQLLGESTALAPSAICTAREADYLTLQIGGT